jgi:hypothetical protein
MWLWNRSGKGANTEEHVLSRLTSISLLPSLSVEESCLSLSNCFQQNNYAAGLQERIEKSKTFE